MGAKEIAKIPGIEIVWPREAPDEESLLFHTPEYLDLVKYGAMASLDTPTEGLYEPSLQSVGATLTAIDSAFERGGVSINVCVGQHHAEPARVKGFCIFDDIGIGVGYARKVYDINRVMIIDGDVHNRDDAWLSFKDDHDVFYHIYASESKNTISLYQWICLGEQ